MSGSATVPSAAVVPSSPLVSARALTKRFGDRAAVEDLSLDVPEGAIFGFIGPSGSGKTTTVRLLVGIYKPTSGTVEVFGAEPSKFSRRQRARIGYMPQLSALYPHLSIEENINFVASLYGVGRERAHAVTALLDLVELSADRKKLFRDASGGMQRRASLAATLVHDPVLLFLDEPTAAIDPVLRRKLWEHFRALRERGRTLFVTTHYVGEAAYCDVVGVLARGRLLALDTPDGLRRRAFGGDFVDLVAAEPLPADVVAELAGRPFVVRTEAIQGDGRGVRLLVPDAGEAIAALSACMSSRGVTLESVQQHVPSFDDVFFAIVDDGDDGA